MYEDHDRKQSEADKRDPREGHCFFIKDIELLTKIWECAGCEQRFNRHDNYNRHVTGGACSGGKTKLICPGGRFERIMNSSEKVFYGGCTKFSYAACQWIEKQSELIGKHIHHALCMHGGEFCVEVEYEEWKMRKVFGWQKFRLMDMNQNQKLFFNITGVNGTDVRAKKKETHLTKKNIPTQ